MGRNSEPDFAPIESWLTNYKHPLIISGPCSAESEKQVILLAKALSKIKHVRVFRAGIWKPRSRPHSFEGYGEKALKWLQHIKEETGLLTAVEVASPEHVELCLKNNIDVLWIGARTTVNPFYVQNIVEALKGVDIPVLIKNPINPDLDLWRGAIERVYNSGIKKIVAIHRGFNTFEKTPYRNNPIWEIPLELMRIYPNLPVICDPSHITGNSAFINDISQKAFNLDMCGLMLETHFNPKDAISDALQQITPLELENLLTTLSFRKKSGNFSFQKQLEKLRNDIDIIDIELLNLLKKRMDIVTEIGNHKKVNDITIYQVKRWNTIINERSELAKKLGLRDDFIIKVLRLVHEESILLQNKIMMSYSKKNNNNK